MIRTNLSAPPARVIALFMLGCIFWSNTHGIETETSTDFEDRSISDSLSQIWQNERSPDSVRFKALEMYFFLNQRTHPDSALLALDYYHELAKEKNATRKIYGVLVSKANLYRDKGNLKVSRALYQEAALLAEDIDDRSLRATVMGNLGNLYLDEKNYVEASRSYTDAIKMFQSLDNLPAQATMLSSLGTLNLAIGNYELAREYFDRSSTVLNAMGADKSSGVLILMNIGMIQYKKAEYDQAKNSFNGALELLEETNDKLLRAGCYGLLARIHLEQGQLEIADDFANKNLLLNTELRNESKILEAQMIKAQIIFETNIDSAAKKAEDLIDKLPTDASYESKVELYELLYKCYKAQDRPALSLQMHEVFMAYKDSLQVEKNNFAVARETVKNDYEIRLFENELEREKEKAQLEVAQLKLTFGIISVALTLIVGLFIFFKNKEKQDRLRRDALLNEIKRLKEEQRNGVMLDSNKFELDRDHIEVAIDRKLNETDWTVLTILLEDPVITNREIAEKAFMSVDGIGSSLRRMYEYFDIKESKYKKISLLMEAIKLSNA